MRSSCSLMSLALLAACNVDTGLAVHNANPTVSITWPGPGGSVPEYETVQLRAQVGDADHRPDLLQVSWFIEGEPLCEGAVPADDGSVSCETRLTVGQTHLAVSVMDPMGGSASAQVDFELDIQEPVLTVTPAIAYTDDVLAAAVSGAYTEDPSRVRWAWYVDGALVPETGPELDGTKWFAKGQRVVAEVHVDDGTSSGRSARSAAVDVRNSAPARLAIALDPETPIAGRGDVRCVVQAAQDADGDALQYSLAWTRNGARFEYATTTVIGGDTIPAAELRPDDAWSCRVEVDDGTEVVGAAVEAVVSRPHFAGWPSAEIDAGDGDFLFAGVRSDTLSGASVAGVGDLDGDGFDDWLIGDPYKGAYRGGGAYVVHASELTGLPGKTVLELTSRMGVDDEDAFAGTAVAGGDLSGDGVPELVVGAPGVDRVFVLEASSLVEGNVWLERTSTWTLRGTQADEDLGASLAVGDLDGDGLADVVAGAPRFDGGADQTGQAYVVLGDTLAAVSGVVDLADADWELRGAAIRDAAGTAVAVAGDLDGDGVDDLVVSAPASDAAGTDAGVVYVVPSADLGSFGTVYLDAASHVLRGSEAGDRAGAALSAVWDVDGDGQDDLLVGAPQAADGAGRAYLVSGADAVAAVTVELGDALRVLEGEAAGDHAGAAVSGTGDVDGDRRGDLLVGAPDRSGGGAAYLLLSGSWDGSAADSLGSRDYVFAGLGATGAALGWIGDVNGDGLSDLAVGSPAGNRYNGHTRGITSLFVAPTD